MEQNNKLSLYKKIGEVMSKVSRVPKNGYNSFHKYQYATESDLTESIRPILLESKLAFFSSVLEQDREGEFTKVKMEFILADLETGETITSIYWGEGQDKGDKGLYKAYTGATKYFLMKTFLIPTGDDPELDNHQQQNKGYTNTPNQQQNTYSGQNNANKSKSGASKKQIGMIKGKIKELSEKSGHEEETIKKSLRSKQDIGAFDSIEDMSVGQASKAIMYLQEWISQ